MFYFLIWALEGVLQMTKIYIYQDTVLTQVMIRLKCEAKLM